MTALAITVLILMICGSSVTQHGRSYDQGFRVGVEVRQQTGLPAGSSSLREFCQRASYTVDQSMRNGRQWLAGYQAGCSG